LNETFCRTLLRAGLTEDDIAARLGVDPKTVRRWIEGRALPYRRHRWTLAALLGTAETDLWPQLRSVQAKPAEVVAIYPRLNAVPSEVWRNLFGSAQHEISLLDQVEQPLAGDHYAVKVLAERAGAGIVVRICLGDSGNNEADERGAVALYAPLRDSGQTEIRLYRGVLYSLIYRADDQLLVAQRAYGIRTARTPVLHLQRTDGGDMFTTYLQSFERSWADAHSLDWLNRPPSEIE
jgi:transcriptional regulator with XRE-family HTH domain